MKPRKPLPKNSRPIPRGKRPKAKKRSPSAFARIYGSKARVQWIKNQHCVACGFTGCENHHVVTGGTGYKADADTIIPICPACHRMLHQIGRPAFEKRFNLDLLAHAANIEKRWQSLLARQLPAPLASSTSEK